MAELKPVSIISDSPETNTEGVSFGFQSYIKTISDMIAFKKNKTPLVIGIFGEWGSGKTTLMENIRLTLKTDTRNKNDNNFRKCKTVWFQAWKYSTEDEILAALIEEIFKTMKADNFFEECKAKVEKLAKTLNKKSIFRTLIKAITKIDISEFFNEIKYKDRLGFYDTFQEFFNDLIQTYLNWSPQIKNNKNPDDPKGALIIFIDDLDRCPEGKIVKVLETIKLFMDTKGCVFVIGAAKEIITKALKKTYDDDAKKFMDKIVQVTFNLPHIRKDEFKSFIENIGEYTCSNEIVKYMHLILPATQNNPRRLKRFFNDLNLRYSLLKNRGVEIDCLHLIFWSIIESKDDSLRKKIVENENTGFFFTLQEKIRDKKKEVPNMDNWIIDAPFLKNIPDSLHKYFEDIELIKIVDKFDCKEEQLLQLITMSSVVESAEDIKYKKKREKPGEIEGMVKIPAGKFLFGADRIREKIEKSFEIDIYPVTNGMYKKFIQGNGYGNDDYWTADGQKWRDENKIKHPEFWNDPIFNHPEQPVVGVSFYEAEAYANWANKRLPTEMEWEKAARGEDGLNYPWGNEFDRKKCNSRESGIGKTTSVTLYPNGVSPYGCHDMTGNIWEWCVDQYDDHPLKKEKGLNIEESEIYYAVRGGSWSANAVSCTVTVHGLYPPTVRQSNIGFRLVRPL